MLNVMRDNLRHLKPILWIVAISMVAYLGAYFSCDTDPGGADAPWAAKVDGTTISRPAFLRSARQRDQSYRQVLGEQYEQFRAQLRIGTQSIQSLVDRQIMLNEAAALGLGASHAEIQQRILADPSLKGPDGRFVGKEQYVRMANRAWDGGVAGYEQYLADSIAIEKWVDMVTASVQVTDDELFEVFRTRSDRTEVDYVVVASADQDVDTDVSDDDVRAWYDSHADDYRRAEGKEIAFAVVKRQDMAAKVDVPDADVRAYYDEHTAEFTRPEQRRARHILIRTEPGATPEQIEQARAKAEDLLARIRAGESFEELARTESADELSAQRGGDLGFFGRGEMVPEFDAAVFSAAVGTLTPVVQTTYGFHVIEVTGERAAGTAPFDEVREGIRERLRRTRSAERAEQEARRIRAGLDSADGLPEVAAAEGLTLETATVRRGEAAPSLGIAPAALDAILDLEVGTVGEPVPAREGWAIVAVTGRVPADVAPLDEVASEVKTAVLNDRARQTARATADRALERHGTLEKAAKALGLEVLSSGSLTPGQVLPRTGGMPAGLSDRLFGDDSEVGAGGVVTVPAGAVIYEVTRRDRFDPAEFESSKAALRDEVSNERRNALVEAILTELRNRHDIQINQALIAEYDA